MNNRQAALTELGNKTPEEHSRLERARSLVSAYGWNLTSYQIINHGISHWFSAEKTTVAGFVSYRRLMLNIMHYQ